MTDTFLSVTLWLEQQADSRLKTEFARSDRGQSAQKAHREGGGGADCQHRHTFWDRATGLQLHRAESGNDRQSTEQFWRRVWVTESAVGQSRIGARSFRQGRLATEFTRHQGSCPRVDASAAASTRRPVDRSAPHQPNKPETAQPGLVARQRPLSKTAKYRRRLACKGTLLSAGC